MEEIYRRALYRVEAEVPFVLRVGRFSDALDALFNRTGSHCAAFLTAANPGSVKLPDTQNELAQARLLTELSKRGIAVIPGIGLDADEQSDWPGEKSVLALDIDRQDAVQLAVAFGQLAFVWCPRTAIPVLVMLD